MSEIKVGARVRVEMEGTIASAANFWGMYRVNLNNGGKGHASYTWAAAEHCTVTAPAVEVGDVVTLSVANRLPDGSIIAPNGQTAAHKSGNNWIRDGQRYTSEQASYWGAVVLRIGGTS